MCFSGLANRFIAPLTVALTYFFAPAFGQNNQERGAIQWASRVERHFNFRDDADFQINVLQGPPDAMPPGRLHPSAVRLKSTTAFATVVTSFEKPQPVEFIAVVESYCPGRIQRIGLIDTRGVKHTVYNNSAHAHPEDFRTLLLSFARTPYEVVSVELEINSHPAPGEVQIDAVGIASGFNWQQVYRELSGANFNIHHLPAFTGNSEKLGPEINSRYSEIKPMPSPDGTNLFFSRMYFPGNTGGKSDPQDIYISRLIDGNWSEARNLGIPLNDQYANGLCSISPDGNTLYLINHYRPGSDPAPGLSCSVKTPAGWSSPSGITIEDFHTSGDFQDFYMSADGQVLFMALQRGGGHGKQDLYVSMRTSSGSFGRPLNLGPEVNTAKSEFAPVLMPDNQTLFFASDGHAGYGQSDMFVTRRLDDNWQRWTRPRNLGPAVNGPGWEAYFYPSPGGDCAYFVSSDIKSDGNRNIYRIPVLEQVEWSAPGLHPHEPGSIADMSLPYDESAGISLPAPAPSLHFTRVPKDNIFLIPNPLLFERSKDKLLEHSLTELQKLAAVLWSNPQIRIELAGHTDALGPEKARQQLSEKRVYRIRDYLSSCGIDRNRIHAVGYGSSRPLAPNDTEANRAKNRRVEIRLLDDGS